ncbi:vesicle transport protein GOT1 isoform X2 [Sesamum indicum]|uniref:Vesicle transport protein GOT1 isoform X2 n=1 Tax=Sesamum indicum TaxID=4182 RepID=A0A6I9ST90_SESIN|nr:vesicle transport protein GOT1 isoform X2 [Sesamum indicum]
MEEMYGCKMNNIAHREEREKTCSIIKVGLGLIGFGIFFSFLAIVLFFDRGLLALGNIFWLTGVAILLGWRSTLQLFTNRRNYKGSLSFLLGIFFIFVRWPVVGILVEIYGCFVLFGGFWPSIKVFLYQIPVFGWILQYPALLRGSSN